MCCVSPVQGLSADHARTLLSKAQPFVESALGATEDEAFKPKHFKEFTRHFLAMLTATQRILKGEVWVVDWGIGALVESCTRRGTKTQWSHSELSWSRYWTFSEGGLYVYCRGVVAKLSNVADV
mgnify:CR=1 FL=1